MAPVSIAMYLLLGHTGRLFRDSRPRFRVSYAMMKQQRRVSVCARELAYCVAARVVNVEWENDITGLDPSNDCG